MSNSTMMVPWLHFTSGDHLFFKSWHPESAGAIAGACIGLVLLALFERWLSATRSVLEAHWRRRAFTLLSQVNKRDGRGSPSSDIPEKCCDDEGDIQEVSIPREEPFTQTARQGLGAGVRTMPPFIASHDISRGVMHAVQALLGYLLMLAIMTFQAAYIISIILGLGIGEVLFGRLGSVQSHH